ncbi:hypothetical protein GCM10009765_09870 [Fodinicola feengrottensis]|uniref:SPOR domain-containing protein n=1 Tax=Fodinicola feengrottensis TaxID=435914 RepID=A0ABN2FZ32_9ACTN
MEERRTARPRWVLWRVDDNGNQVEVARYDTKEAAQARIDEFERHRHKQHYWVEPAD